MIQLSIVVPTFNEVQNVGRLLELLSAALTGISYEVVFVDDDSPDGTADKIRAIARTNTNVRVLRRVGRNGLAGACLEGMLAAAAPNIAVMDADLQHDERVLPAMLQLLESKNLDIVIGSRNMAGGGMGEFAQERVALSGMGRRISQLVCRAVVSDPMSGFFLLTRRFLDEVIYDVSAIGFKILVDLLASARRPVRIGEVPYVFRNREAGDSKLDVLVMVEYLQLIADKFTRGLLPARFLLFGAVGASGIAVHLASLAALYQGIGMEFRIAYLCATLLAMSCNFFLNNAITYRDSRLRGFRGIFWGWLTFCLACSLGAVVSVQVAEALRLGGTNWIVASLAGILMASLWNYAITQVLTWGLLRRARNRRRLHRLNAQLGVVSQEAR